MDKLEERIRVHDKDIERMCNYHYQGFIESVNELLKVRGEVRKLKVYECVVSVFNLALFPARCNPVNVLLRFISVCYCTL